MFDISSYYKHEKGSFLASNKEISVITGGWGGGEEEGTHFTSNARINIVF